MTRTTKSPTRAPARSAALKEAASPVPLGSNLSAQLQKSELMDSVGFLLKVAHSVVQSRFGEKLTLLGLRPSLYSILRIIAENPGLRQQDIGQILSIQQPNLVALIAELIEQGWLQRTVNPEDRRSYALTLTRAGSSILAAADAAHRKNEAEAEAAIAPEDVQAFKTTLLKLMLPNQD